MSKKIGAKDVSQEEFQRMVDHRRANRMAMVDRMAPEWRALVHEYGLSIVLACKDAGVKRARNARHIVEVVLDEFSPTRGSYSSQGARRALGIGVDLDAPL